MQRDDRSALERLRAQLIRTERPLTEEESATLDALLTEALERAGVAAPEVVTVMNPVSRPQRLKLAVLVSDPGLDSMYGRERAELSVSDEGICYLVYRRSDGGDYAIVWSPSTLLPTTTMAMMPDVLVEAMLEGAG